MSLGRYDASMFDFVTVDQASNLILIAAIWILIMWIMVIYGGRKK